MTSRADSTPSNHALRAFRGTILLVGAGKMGSALLEGWVALGLQPGSLMVIEPNPSAAVGALVGKGLRLNPVENPDDVAALVLAVKPQVAPEVTQTLTPFLGAATVVISIMAGRTLRFLESSFPHAAVVRAMPNTPASIGCGVTVAVPNPRVSGEQRALVNGLLSAVGAVEWIDDEALMDAVTALSGSGPAYIFLLAEAMARAGAAAGLSPALASALARATVAGSGELLRRSPLDAASLRENVTSPGGTTAAALEVLMGRSGLQELMTKAIAAAARRSRELAG
jgi:pyrroline-5-carboxylate reductase